MTFLLLAFFIGIGKSQTPGIQKGIRWDALSKPVYADPDDGFVKDPSIVQADGQFYMFYTGAAPDFQGGKPPWRIEYATSPDGLKWTKQGASFVADDNTWEAGRIQAPSRPIWHDGQYYMFYAGGPRKPVNLVYTGYATSKDLIHWTKHSQIIRHDDKANDPFLFEEGGTFYLFYTTYAEGEPIYYRTSTDLRTWSDPIKTDAEGEGSVVWKGSEGGYYLIACVGYSGKGELYKLYHSEKLTGFKDLGKIDMNVPSWASDAFGHGDVIRKGDEDWLYFQGTRDGGKTFQIGLATRKIDRSARDNEVKSTRRPGPWA